MMPWIAAGWLASLIGAGWFAYERGKESEIASQYREQAAAEKAAAAAIDAAVDAINAQEVKNVTITRNLQREVITREVFRDCRSGPDAVRLLNDTVEAGKSADRNALQGAADKAR